MPERTPPAPDEGWRDIQLEDLARGVGFLVNLVSDVLESVGASVGQQRTPAARPVARPRPQPEARPEPAGAGLRDPNVDLFDEGDELVIVVEGLAGDAGQIAVDVRDDVLSLAIGGDHPYSADLLLPGPVDPASLRQWSRNRIVEIRLRRA